MQLKKLGRQVKMPRVNSFDHSTGRVLFFLLALFALILSPSQTYAQGSGTVTDLNATGAKPFSSIAGSDIENIDLNTGGLNVNMLVSETSGRGALNLPIALNYSSKYCDELMLPFDEGGPRMDTNDNAGWGFNTPRLDSQFVEFKCFPDTSSFDSYENA